MNEVCSCGKVATHTIEWMTNEPKIEEITYLCDECGIGSNMSDENKDTDTLVEIGYIEEFILHIDLKGG